MAIISRPNRYKVKDKDLLKHLYIDNKLKTEDCSIILNCSKGAVNNALKRNNIHIRKLSDYTKGKKHTVEAKKKMSEIKKGKIPKNLSLINSPENIIKKIIFITANGGLFKGRHHTELSKNKISIAKKGIKLTEETKKKIGDSHRGKIGYWFGKKLTKEHINKCLKRRIPTSLEDKFQNIINKYNLPYKYVGNGMFFIERFNPDFININGDKIAIEVYARYYKKRNNISIEDWKTERTNIFNKYGWNIIYFDETQVNDNYVLNILERGD